MNGPFLAGILGWEVPEGPGNGRFSSAWLKILIFKPKKDCRTNLGNISHQKLDQKVRKYSRSTGISLGKGREGGISLAWLQRALEINFCREKQRL